MDALISYVFFNYGDLMTPHEGLAYKSIIGKLKADHAHSPGERELLLREWVSKDPEVLQLLEGDSEQFFVNVSQRILQEHPAEVFLNRCPRCDGLARTPYAKQCRHCFFSWHDDREQ